MIPRVISICILLLSIVVGPLAAAQKIERIGAPTSVSDALQQAVETKGYRVTLDGGWKAEFWFAKTLKTEKKDVSDALYPELSNGEFVGVVTFSQAMTDYRGQNIPAGTYTLRYQTLPQDGNHMGVAPNPDFLLAIPAANDSSPDATYPYKKLVALSAKSTGTNHPAVIALDKAGEPSRITKTERGDTVFSVAIPSRQGTAENLGIVLKGTAAQ
ncbi:MAG: hypothetical protein WBW69_05060 [Candidatus Korobacteraceae bacterium]